VAAFQIFGPDHLAALAVTTILSLFAVLLGRRQRAVRALPWALVLAVAAGQVLSTFIEAHYRPLSLQRSLPLELCDIASFVTIVALLTRRQLAFELCWFWGLSGTVGALLAPGVAFGFPHPEYFRFFAMHGGIVAGALYLGPGLGMKTRPGAGRRIFGLTLLYALGIAMLDWALDANYFYLRRAPEGSFLESVGAWPYYLLPGALIAAVLFWMLDRAGRDRARA